MRNSTSFVAEFTNSLNKISMLLFAALCALSILAGTAYAQKFTSLASFDYTNGSAPETGFVQGIDGNLYGTVYAGGAGAPGQGGAGTVVKVTPSGNLTVIYNFCAKTGCADGIFPGAALVLTSGGTLYGTTREGGSSSGGGAGTAFKVSYSGSLTTLHGFNTWSQAATPQAMVQGVDGNLYGVAFQGGANDQGAIFKLTPSGAFSTVYSFCAQPNCTDGSAPQWITLGQDGNLYGVAGGGGANGIGGTVFKLTPMVPSRLSIAFVRR